MNYKIEKYINDNPIAIVGTINPDGTPHGAVVYVYADAKKARMYFITKHETQKYRNAQRHNRVSVTIVNPAENSTLQADGRIFEVEEPETINLVMDEIASHHTSALQWLPPIAKIRAGAYVVMGVELLHARLAQFKGMSIGDEHIFTQLKP